MKVHSRKKNTEVRHEDFWKLFEKSAIKDLVEEFINTADKDRVLIKRKTKAETRGIEEEIDRVNERYEENDSSGSESDDDEVGTKVQRKVRGKRKRKK